MTIRLHAITLHARPTVLAGTIVLHDDTTGRTVTMRVLETNAPPGYRVVADGDDAELPNWPVFVVEADRIMTTLLITADEIADRYAAARTVIDGFPLARIPAPDLEHLLWRFIRGEIDTDGLRDHITALDQVLDNDAITQAGDAATTAVPDATDAPEGG